MNLGIDFGSSFSEFAVCSKQGEPEALQFSENGSPFVPTVACIRDGEPMCTGFAAVDKLTNKKYQRFLTCKMLLNAGRDEWLTHDSYSAEHTPEQVAGAFLSDHVVKALGLSEKPNDRVDQMVICIPELWNKVIHDPDPKNTLLNICRDIPMVQKVKYITEPEAASAYAAYNYRQSGQNGYHGMLLIIDYGGGTLDITLTQVDSQENGAVRITTRGRCGDGENHNGKIGVAGVTYMTALAEKSLHDAGLTYEKNSRFFTAFLMRLERSIIHNSDAIRARLTRYRVNPAAFGDDGAVFDRICYGSEEDDVEITYRNIYTVYQNEIRKVLEEQLKIIDERFRDAEIKKLVPNPFDPQCETFKIVLVGGFGRYALVENQVYRHYRVVDENVDKRVDRRILGKRESAVAYGAALIANDQITVRRTSSQSLGIVGKTPNGKDAFRYAILSGQIMQEDTVYYLRENPDPGFPNRNVIRVGFYPKEGLVFAINDSDDLTKTFRHKMKPEYCSRLTAIEGGIYAVGFCIDSDSIIHLVLSEYKGENRTAGHEKHRIRLDSYERMFMHDDVTFFDRDSSMTQS